MKNQRAKTPFKTLSILLISVLVLSAGVATVGVATAQTSPGQPVEFYGTIVNEDGDPAPTGIEVYATVNGSNESSIEVTESGQYGSDDFDDRLTVNDGAGEDVRFTVNSPDGPESTGSPYPLDDQDAVNELNLTFPTGAFEQDTDDDVDDGGTGGDGGGGGGGGAGGGGGDGADDTPSDISDIRDLLTLVDPSNTLQVQIADNDPDTPGTQISPEGTLVQSISFDEEDLSGNVDINEYTDPRQEVRNTVTEAVRTSGAVDRGDVSTIALADITPSTDAASDSASTVEFTVPTDQVDNPEQLTVVKETYDFDQQEDTLTELDTTLEETGDQEVTVSARAESFSLFAVAEVDQDGEPATDDGQQDDGQQDDGQQDDGQQGEGSSTALLIVGVLIVLAALGAFLYARQN